MGRLISALAARLLRCAAFLSPPPAAAATDRAMWSEDALEARSVRRAQVNPGAGRALGAALAVPRRGREQASRHGQCAGDARPCSCAGDADRVPRRAGDERRSLAGVYQAAGRRARGCSPARAAAASACCLECGIAVP